MVCSDFALQLILSHLVSHQHFFHILFLLCFILESTGHCEDEVIRILVAPVNSYLTESVVFHSPYLFEALLESLHLGLIIVLDTVLCPHFF